MIIYTGSKKQFQSDVMTNDIGGIIYEAYKKVTGRSTGKSELDSWTNSLQFMERIICDRDIPLDVEIAIEYHIPQSSKRIDFILSGQNGAKEDTAILIELKQWQSAGLTTKDGVVTTRFKHSEQETAHPSYQVWSYKRLLEDFNQTVEEDKINLIPCAYLHNYEPDNVITNNFYGDYLESAPAFLKPDALKLQNFIKTHVKYGDKNQIMYRIDHGKIRPSKNLADHMSSMLAGNKEFVMIDDQKVVYEAALELSVRAQTGAKQVLIVEGGPGTGKSVLSINLLVEFTRQQLLTQYVTRNAAPREVYKAKLTNSMRKSHIDNLFSGSGAFHTLSNDTFDCLIVDEAHRLNAKSGMFNHLGENQILEIVRSSKFSVFFIDEDQKVTLKDIGDKEAIRQFARLEDANVTELSLQSQFRCNGSDGYLALLDSILQIHETANETMDHIDYDFRVFDTPEQLHDVIRDKNKDKNKARMVAGYCWKWISKRSPSLKDIIIGDYQATWNLNEDGQAWIIQPNSVSEIGCIHTCQGLELDFVGVVIGPDLLVRNGKVITRPAERASTDKSIYGWKSLMKEDPDSTTARLDAIIKNTYRTLMTRGQKGCYIYCTDLETSEYFKGLVNR